MTDTGIHSNAYDIIMHCICGCFWGMEEMNGNYGKKIHTGMVDIGFTVFH
jgi:peptide methionine sulfoxide reductase MsrA